MKGIESSFQTMTPGISTVGTEAGLGAVPIIGALRTKGGNRFVT